MSDAGFNAFKMEALYKGLIEWRKHELNYPVFAKELEGVLSQIVSLKKQLLKSSSESEAADSAIADLLYQIAKCDSQISDCEKTVGDLTQTLKTPPWSVRRCSRKIYQIKVKELIESEKDEIKHIETQFAYKSEVLMQKQAFKRVDFNAEQENYKNQIAELDAREKSDIELQKTKFTEKYHALSNESRDTKRSEIIDNMRRIAAQKSQLKRSKNDEIALCENKLELNLASLKKKHQYEIGCLHDDICSIDTHVSDILADQEEELSQILLQFQRDADSLNTERRLEAGKLKIENERVKEDYENRINQCGLELDDKVRSWVASNSTSHTLIEKGHRKDYNRLEALNSLWAWVAILFVPSTIVTSVVFISSGVLGASLVISLFFMAGGFFAAGLYFVTKNDLTTLSLKQAQTKRDFDKNTVKFIDNLKHHYASRRDELEKEMHCVIENARLNFGSNHRAKEANLESAYSAKVEEIKATHAEKMAYKKMDNGRAIALIEEKGRLFESEKLSLQQRSCQANHSNS